MKKFALATIALAIGTNLFAAPQATEKSKAPSTTTDGKAGEKEKAKQDKKAKTNKEREKDKGTKRHRLHL